MNVETADSELWRRCANDGFVELPWFLVGHAITELLASRIRLVNGAVANFLPEQIFYESKNNPSTRRQIQHMGDQDPSFRELFVASQFRELAEWWLEGPVNSNSMLSFNKPPHQDGDYF